LLSGDRARLNGVLRCRAAAGTLQLAAIGSPRVGVAQRGFKPGVRGGSGRSATDPPLQALFLQRPGVLVATPDSGIETVGEDRVGAGDIHRYAVEPRVQRARRARWAALGADQRDRDR